MAPRRVIRLAPNCAINLDEFLTTTQAILAKKRVGKTYTAQVQAEALLEAGEQIVVIDPTDAWWGLRSSADGKAAGYPIVVFGGDHGDAPLEETAGVMLAEAIVADRFSAVLSLSKLKPKARARFIADFLEAFYQLNREAMHLFIDEADVAAPQVSRTPEHDRALGATDEIVRRGGIKGIGVTLISQRSQLVNKDVLSQIDQLIVLRMNHPKDIRAVTDWLANHVKLDSVKEMIRSLPALPQGVGWVWIPDATIFERIAINPKKTFDSGATPKAGERRIKPKVLAPVDIEQLGEKIAATVERVKANDPTALKAEVARLKRELAAAHAKPAPPTPKVDLTGLKNGIDTLEKAIDGLEAQLRAGWAARDQAAHAVHEDISTTHSDGRERATPPKIKTVPMRLYVGNSPSPATVERLDMIEHMVTGRHPLPKGEHAVLTALIQYPDGVEKSDLTVLTGYKRSTRDAYLARLRERRFVEEHGGLTLATAAGRAALPDAKPLPTGVALRDWWFLRLPKGEADVLRILTGAYPNSVDKPRIDERTGFKRSTRDAYLARLAAKRLVADVGRGEVKAADALFT